MAEENTPTFLQGTEKNPHIETLKQAVNIHKGN